MSIFKSFKTFFSNNDYFKNVEIGWVTSQERHFFDNIHFTYWHSDGSDVTSSLPGWGIAFSATYFVDNTWMPFLRGGYAEDGGSGSDTTVLQENMVLCVESYMGEVGGREGVKLEEQVLITAGGVEVLSSYPFETDLL